MCDLDISKLLFAFYFIYSVGTHRSIIFAASFLYATVGLSHANSVVNHLRLPLNYLSYRSATSGLLLQELQL